jgi:hypothetical protein
MSRNRGVLSWGYKPEVWQCRRGVRVVRRQ